MNEHDFATGADDEKLIPYGLYDLQRQEGFVVCNTSHDTAEFVYNCIKRWWEEVGIIAYPRAKRLLFLTDSGGSDSCRSHMFKKYMQDLADETGLEIHISHYPRGTSKWNPIEHRLFSQISKSMQGKPLVSVDYAMKLIGNTKTKTGLSVRCQLDNAHYKTGQKISNKEFKAIPVMKKRSVRKLNYWFKPKVARKAPKVSKNLVGE